ncbi:MAG: amidohydrolase family protein [Firmicutes bacterium]|nr:amidohydrolase family protein [Bacillota bacterium]
MQGRDSFKSTIEKIPIVDTHEHVVSLAEVRSRPLNVFSVFANSYARLDFISAGMPAQAWEGVDEPDYIWPIFREYQPFVRHTSFYRNMIKALQDLFGLEEDEITEKNQRELSYSITKAYKRQDWYDYVLRERAKMAVGLLDTFWSVEKFTFDPALFKPVLRCNPFIWGPAYELPYVSGKTNHTKVEIVAKEFGLAINSLEDYLKLISSVIKRYKEAGAPNIKICTAYQRTLKFHPVSRKRALQLYNRVGDLTPEERLELQDFIAHYIIEAAIAEDLPIQIHTGILARNRATLSDSSPEHLNSLFLRYPEARFVILHFGFPYTQQAISLAKMFPNVYIDLVWLPLLSPVAAKETLNVCLDLVPTNKIMCGGDAYRAEEAYASLSLLRDTVADVLYERVERGILNSGEALQIAQRIFFENAIKFFSLPLEGGCADMLRDYKV